MVKIVQRVSNCVADLIMYYRLICVL